MQKLIFIILSLSISIISSEAKNENKEEINLYILNKCISEISATQKVNEENIAEIRECVLNSSSTSPIDTNITLDIGECILNIPSTVKVGISTDYDVNLIDQMTFDVYTLGWRKDSLNYWQKELQAKSIEIEKNKNLNIINRQDSDYKIIVGRNFYIFISKSNTISLKLVKECNDTWRNNITQLDTETMIDTFHLDERERKILEEIIREFY